MCLLVTTSSLLKQFLLKDNIFRSLMKKKLSPKKVEEAINRSESVNSDIEKTLTISSEVSNFSEASRKSVKFHFRISYPVLHSLLKMVFGEKCFEGCNLFACH